MNRRVARFGADRGAERRVGCAMNESGMALELPAHWPSAWPHLWRPVVRRAIFVASVIVLTWLGLLVAGDVSHEWWLLLVPLVLIIGPITQPGRVRRSLQRSARTGRYRAAIGRLRCDADGFWVDFGDDQPGLLLPIGSMGPAIYGLAGSDVTLVWRGSWWRRSAARALVLSECRVGYLPPGDGARSLPTSDAVIPVKSVQATLITD